MLPDATKRSNEKSTLTPAVKRALVTLEKAV